MKKQLAILISGSGTNMEAIIKSTQSGVLKDLADVSVVVSNKGEAGGLEKARQLGITSHCVPSVKKEREVFERELLSLLKNYSVDYVVLAGFMRILSPVFIKVYAGKIINIHPADTAAFQGVGGYEWAFNEQLASTKITVHFVDEGVDTGKVIAQATVDLKGAQSVEEVTERGLKVENVFYSQALADMISKKNKETLCVVS